MPCHAYILKSLLSVNLKMLGRWFLALALVSGFGLDAAATAFAVVASPSLGQPHKQAEQIADIEAFVRDGCPHCAKAEVFLQTLKREHPELNIVIHDVIQEPEALVRLQELAQSQGVSAARVPAFQVAGQLIVGYSDEITTGQLIRSALARSQTKTAKNADMAGSCEAKQALVCEPEIEATQTTEPAFAVDFLGYRLSPSEIGLPLFTLAMGLLDGFNPCSLWVLILMISLLSPLKDRGRMFAIAGTFVAVEGLVYFMFMAAWLNLFLFIGLSRASEITVALIALLAGLINLKDFLFFGRGISLSVPETAKPGIYARMRKILHAQNLLGAIIGAVVLAILVQLVEFMCTSGFPALYTQILTLENLHNISYYSYLLLYNLAYMFDDVVILTIGIVTLSQRRLQQQEGRWLKLVSGFVMVGLALYLLVSPA
ncbi:MAG: NrdH-redoxin [Methylovulum sp.]|nr:NrdH-redoxin [Methylovulum sp.]